MPQPDYESIRLDLTQHIIDRKGFSYYARVLKNLIEAIERVLQRDQEVTEAQRKAGVTLDGKEFNRANLIIKQALDSVEQEPQAEQNPRSAPRLASRPVGSAQRSAPTKPVPPKSAPPRSAPPRSAPPRSAQERPSLLSRFSLPAFSLSSGLQFPVGSPSDDAWWKRDYPQMPLSPKHDLMTLAADLATNQFLLDTFLTQQKWMTPYQKLFIGNFIMGYFTPSPQMYPVHQNMRHGGTKGWHPLEKAKAYIASAGPFMIKILQQIGNDRSLNQTVKDLTQSVFSSIPALPEREFLYLKSKLGLAPKYLNVRTKAIGAASIGETHVCENDAEVPIGVVKFIKPVSVWMFLCEVDFLLTVLWPSFEPPSNATPQDKLNSKKCRQLLLFLTREFAKEFDVQREAQGTRDAREVYYRPNIGIRTPELLDWSTAPVPALVLEYIKGQSLEDFMVRLKSIPSEEERHALMVPIQRRITVLVGLWLKELFWGGGRFDADPHIGNFIVPSFEELRDPSKIPWIALIDFGSHGKLDPFMQCVVFKSLYTGSKIVQFNDCVPQPPTAGPPMNPDTLALLLRTNPMLKYFPSFPTMSRVDQLELVKRVEARVRKYPNVDEENHKYVKQIVTSMWKICNVWDNEAETKRLVEQCLDYEKTIDFLFISLTLAQYGETIGVCSWNSVLMYGRGLAYLEALWTATAGECGKYEKVLEANERDLSKHLMHDVPKCDQRSLLTLVWPFFATNPKLGFNMVRGCPR